jgi:hypothetical protein
MGSYIENYKNTVMKKFFSFLTMAVVMTTACKNNSKSNAEARLKAYQDSVTLANDTAGLAQFQQWKAQNELGEQQEVEQQDQQMAVAAAQPRSYAPARKTTTKRSGTSSSGNSNRGTASSGSGNTAKAPVKKGWSKAAKGAAIGTAGGAVVGAVVNKKNRVVGGVVGGVLGGAAGYGIGRSKDKKDGR